MYSTSVLSVVTGTFTFNLFIARRLFTCACWQSTCLFCDWTLIDFVTIFTGTAIMYYLLYIVYFMGTCRLEFVSLFSPTVSSQTLILVRLLFMTRLLPHSFIWLRDILYLVRHRSIYRSVKPLPFPVLRTHISFDGGWHCCLYLLPFGGTAHLQN